MKKGRLTKIEQTRRLKLLLEFIFIFRYAARYQLFEFSRTIIGLTHPRWLVDYACKRGLIHSYFAPIFKVNIKKGKDLINEQEALIKHYRFEKRHAGVNSFQKHNLLVNMYLTLNRYVDVRLMNWESEWILRIGRHKWESIPDSVFILPYGTKIAIELELQHKRLDFLKRKVSVYRYDIEKVRYHAVFIIASDHKYYEGLKKRLSKVAPFFCQKAFIFAYPDMLEQGLCFYNNEVMGLKELGYLLKLQNTDVVVKMSEIKNNPEVKS